MSYSYEVTVDEKAYDLFHVAALHILEGWGFETGLHVSSMEGSGVTEYHRDDDIVTFSDTQEPHSQLRLTLLSDTVEVLSLIAAIIEYAVAQLASSFWAPALGVTREDLAAEVARSVRQVWERTRVEHGHDAKESQQ